MADERPTTEPPMPLSGTSYTKTFWVLLLLVKRSLYISEEWLSLSCALCWIYWSSTSSRRHAVGHDVSWHTLDHSSIPFEVIQAQACRCVKTFSLVCKSQLKIDCKLEQKSSFLLGMLGLFVFLLKAKQWIKRSRKVTVICLERFWRRNVSLPIFSLSLYL